MASYSPISEYSSDMSRQTPSPTTPPSEYNYQDYSSQYPQYPPANDVYQHPHVYSHQQLYASSTSSLQSSAPSSSHYQPSSHVDPTRNPHHQHQHHYSHPGSVNPQYAQSANPQYPAFDTYRTPGHDQRVHPSLQYGYQSQPNSAPHSSYEDLVGRTQSPNGYYPPSQQNMGYTHARSESAPSVGIPTSPSSPTMSQTHSRSPTGLPLEKIYKCPTCQTAFARNHDLTRHQKSHEPIKAYHCTGCSKSFTRKDALKRHATQKACGGEYNPKAGPPSKHSTALSSPGFPGSDSDSSYTYK